VHRRRYCKEDTSLLSRDNGQLWPCIILAGVEEDCSFNTVLVGVWASTQTKLACWSFTTVAQPEHSMQDGMPGDDGGVGGGARGADDVQVGLQDLLQHHVLRVLEAAREGTYVIRSSRAGSSRIRP